MQSADEFYFSLHSTMFLLILGDIGSGEIAADFTFHNVSINTTRGKLWKCHESAFTFHNVSINTAKMLGITPKTFYFTFHNVSINTLST